MIGPYPDGGGLYRQRKPASTTSAGLGGVHRDGAAILALCNSAITAVDHFCHIQIAATA
jgi:hypothetical protein